MALTSANVEVFGFSRHRRAASARILIIRLSHARAAPCFLTPADYGLKRGRGRRRRLRRSRGIATPVTRQHGLRSGLEQVPHLAQRDREGCEIEDAAGFNVGHNLAAAFDRRDVESYPGVDTCFGRGLRHIRTARPRR